jgi:hypothetical protein
MDPARYHHWRKSASAQIIGRSGQASQATWPSGGPTGADGTGTKDGGGVPTSLAGRNSMTVFRVPSDPAVSYRRL